MRLRPLAVAAALMVLPATASADDAVPLTGTGENIAPIARIKVPGANEIAVAGDWAFVSTDAVEETCGCLYILNIKDPAHPTVEGIWDARKAGLKDQSYGDVDISPDANLTVLTNAHGSGPTWAAVIDTSDKAHPKMLSHIDDDGTMDYVHTSTLDNKLLYMNPQVFAGYPQPNHAAITVMDLTDPTHPKSVGKVTTPGADVGLAHDTYIDHRPDGKSLMYAASMSKSDVIDVTNPLQSNWLQSIVGKDTTISHDVQPNFDRSVILVDDEGAGGGQLDPHVSACGHAGQGPASVNSGSLHFYAADADGTWTNNGLTELGSFNAPANVNEAECVAHVFWQAPNENRLTQAYYNVGAWVLDFKDPSNPTALAHFRGEGAKYWSNKPHNGYMYASNMNGSVDVLRYTGEGGKAWPTTSGPAEIQLSARQGIPYTPIATPAPAAATPPPAAPATGPTSSTGTPPASGATFGRFALKIKGKRVRGKRGARRRVTLTFFDAKGTRVLVKRFKRAAGRKARAKVTGVAVSGAYRYTLKAGRRKLARGRFTVGTVKDLASSATLVARVK